MITTRLVRVTALIAVLTGVTFLPTAAASGGFDEQFSASVLDSSWTVVPGIRGASGFPPPANDYSLTANAGHLRYTLNPMTHYDGFLNSYQPAFRSCCIHDPGLELHRPFTGDYWTLESKVSYHMPFANGRVFDLRVYWGDGSEGTFYAAFQRVRDVHPFNGLCSNLNQRGPSQGYNDFDRILLEAPPCSMLPGFDGTDTTHYLRLTRAGGLLTAMLSDDGVNWTTTWSHDLGSQLDGLDQRVVITGLSWFVPAGSYADYDYIAVTPTVVPVAIDIKPGGFPNSINVAKKGVIPVAVLSTATFDASTVDPGTTCFGDAEDESQRDCTVAPGTILEDVDSDGLLDLVLHFETQQTGIDLGDTQACLTGEVFDGRPIEGCDSVKTK